MGYVRTSSAANVGADRDSETRQRLAIERHAAVVGVELVGWYNDPAVSGADPVETRPGFAAMLGHIEGNGVRLVLVEDASRFARSVIAAELGVLLMIQRGVRVVTAGGEDLTQAEDPAKVMMRQVAATFAEYEKARLVGKLRGARDRASERAGRRVEGRKGVGRTAAGAGARGQTAGAAQPEDGREAVIARDRGRAGGAGFRQRRGAAVRCGPGAAAARFQLIAGQNDPGRIIGAGGQRQRCLCRLTGSPTPPHHLSRAQPCH